jgi:transglutaminase-like putative cysteine protease
VVAADPALLARLQAGWQTEAPSTVEVLESLRYQVTEHIEVVNLGPGQTHKHNLWLALIQSRAPYQSVTDLKIASPAYSLVEDEFGNLYLQFDFGELPIGQPVVIELKYQVSINRLRSDLTICDGPTIEGYTQAEFLIEANNPEIVALSSSIPAAASDPCQQARAFYDYVGNSLAYTVNNGDWGAMAALGPSGSDCTEYASLFIALCRAAAIPARYLEGLNYRGLYADVEANLEHAWAEIYLPGSGWMPVDPTLGRLNTTRERYFASFPADHIIVTMGRHPSTLRGKSYFAHLYWGVDQTTIQVQNFGWTIEPIQ